MTRELSAEDCAAIRDVHDVWIAAEVRGDMQTVLALCSDDVQILTPNTEIVEGEAAVQEMLQPDAIKLDGIETRDLRVAGAGYLAYKTCRYETRFIVQGGPENRVARGTHLWILRKDGGNWKVVLVTWHPQA